MSAWMPAPPPESDPAMLRIRTGFFIGISATTVFPAHPTLSYKGRGKKHLGRERVNLGAGFADHLRDLAHHLTDQLLVFALAHDADDRLGARFAHQQPAAPVQSLFARLD